ncbi:hypothetical protein FOL47_009215 [Perkinsus chesapeaki]|uniref:Uncharacterized protein n=1 Tax=Perkinsus chesapeaki TaxID=330153 RepID=A0A7J6L9R0_PERCH|nr:hypothetical protein FOL47_009215 [Perkinsus chesapeaki]
MKQAFFAVLAPLLCAGYTKPHGVLRRLDSAPYGNPEGHCVFDMESGQVKNCTCPSGEIPLTYMNSQACGTSPCQDDSDCPLPPKGVTAGHHCYSSRMPSACMLVCQEGEVCQTGATCIDGLCVFAH